MFLCFIVYSALSGLCIVLLDKWRSLYTNSLSLLCHLKEFAFFLASVQKTIKKGEMRISISDKQQNLWCLNDYLLMVRQKCVNV